MKDIETMEDIRLFVGIFYSKVKDDKLLADIFNVKIEDRWQEHLEKMYRFWQTVLLEEHTYFGSPFLPHANLPLTAIHFESWLRLFNETIDSLFYGKNAMRAKLQGERMAKMFESKIEFLKCKAS